MSGNISFQLFPKPSLDHLGLHCQMLLSPHDIIISFFSKLLQTLPGTCLVAFFLSCLSSLEIGRYGLLLALQLSHSVTLSLGKSLVIWRRRGVQNYCFLGSTGPLPPQKIPQEPRGYSCSLRKKLHSRCLSQVEIITEDGVAHVVNTGDS